MSVAPGRFVTLPGLVVVVVPPLPTLVVVVVVRVTELPPFMAAIIESAFTTAMALISESFCIIICMRMESTRAFTVESICASDMPPVFSVLQAAKASIPPARNKRDCFFIVCFFLNVLQNYVILRQIHSKENANYRPRAFWVTILMRFFVSFHKL